MLSRFDTASAGQVGFGSRPAEPPETRPLLGRLFRADRMADLLVVLLVLYTGFVLTPVFEAADFDDLDLSQEIATTAGSNIVNQLFWFVATILGLLAVGPQWRTRLSRLVLGNPWLFGLAALGIVSCLWALEPMISLRRSIQQAMVIFCIAAAVGGASSLDRLLRMIYLGFAITLVVHMLALPLPTSYDWRHAFRGFFSDKNGLGGLAAVAILFGGAIRSILETRAARIWNLAYLGCWLVLLVLSLSKTSMALVVIVPAIYMGLNLVSRATRLGLGIYFVLVPVILGSLLAFVVFGAGISFMELAAMISPDVTFTGRTSIWVFVLDQLQGHWLLGYGFHSFWSIGESSPSLTAPDHFIRFLNQAHNGFLDLVLSVGLIGLGLFLCAIVQGAAAASRVRGAWPAIHRLCWPLIIFALIHNMSESSLLRGFSPPWLFLLFALHMAARAASEAAGRTEPSLSAERPEAR
ncbi:MAG TPA: O-antigen ligase family protein [Geminicoccus sp.]|uniref:O-antigen ligase family protein n=1 Tax=Geminicoccus sp. TaxID=2024832 RepID=UPI002E37345C|nr:O-antigen ligase family protein [Geminicoccus sp.]HEX2526159.1 O-antigen ligase family protein [Geminicoccus sp.]